MLKRVAQTLMAFGIAIMFRVAVRFVQFAVWWDQHYDRMYAEKPQRRA